MLLESAAILLRWYDDRCLDVKTASIFLKLSNLTHGLGAARGILVKCASCFEFSTTVSYDINKPRHGWRCVKGRSREKVNPLRTSGGAGVSPNRE